MQLRFFQDDKFLAKMQAFKDEEGLLRIRTKLVDSDEKEDFKFPVLLPANDVVVKLIREEHKKAMHAGFGKLITDIEVNISAADVSIAQPSGRLHIFDRKTNLKFLIDSGSEVWCLPVSKTKRKLVPEPIQLTAANN
ncbi:integrase_H2C2 domain-containing protein [Nephila pilipes]|uniref:Integrase_H2C2 domain-containing protein n=1 Tax=Nephila pilipes TaxID=299642 RepID=A0A8X6QNL5_NEPPI|nr:integrase_H2C2 domain-containing protein [Nephila pilipes]